MSNNIGYLSKNKSKGNTYIYLSKTVRDDRKNATKETIYPFGKMPEALEKMYEWRKNFNVFPKELQERGYDREDLIEWIKTIETKMTKTGRKFNV